MVLLLLLLLGWERRVAAYLRKLRDVTQVALAERARGVKLECIGTPLLLLLLLLDREKGVAAYLRKLRDVTQVALAERARG